jgi:hypothetical protein
VANIQKEISNAIGRPVTLRFWVLPANLVVTEDPDLPGDRANIVGDIDGSE